MEIQDDTINTFLSETLSELRLSLPIKDTLCPHCGVPVRYPLVARQSDIDLFKNLFESMNRLALKYGITQNLLAEIRTDAIIEILKRDSK